MYKVTINHQRPCTRRGDLEDEIVMESSEIFKTRKAAKDYIESKLRGKNSANIRRYYHRGDEPSYCYYFTGKTWINENSGSNCEEKYIYTLSKVKAK